MAWLLAAVVTAPLIAAGAPPSGEPVVEPVEPASGEPPIEQLPFEPPAAPEPPWPPKPPGNDEPVDPPDRRLRRAGFGLIGVGSASLVAGVTLHVLGRRARTRFEAAGASEGTTGFPDVQYADAREDLRRAQRFGVAAVATYAVGILAGVGGAALLGTHSVRKRQHLRFEARRLAGGFGLAVSARI